MRWRSTVASADSVIRVSIIGDAKKLVGATKEADKSIGGLVKKAGPALAGLAVAAGGFEFAQDSLNEADRLGDAMTRLEISIGKTDAEKLSGIAEDFHNLGLSKQDVLELSAHFADLGTNAGIAAPDIASLSDDVSATAAAISLLDGSDPSANVELLGKAAGGSAKAMKALGINVSEAEVEARALKDTGKKTADSLTEGEKATARLNVVLDKLKPKLDAAKTGSGDLEQSQKDLQAQVETLQAKLGGPLSDALNSVVGFILDEIDAIPGAIEGWKSLGGAIEGFARTVAAPLGNIKDLIDGILGGLTTLGQTPVSTGGGSSGTGGRSTGFGRPSENATTRNIQRTRERSGGIGASMGGP
jgi:hypothetical protein